MSKNDPLQLAQEFLQRMGSGAEPAEIAKLFSENMEWEIAGDTGVLPWIGQKSGRAAITAFVNDSRAMIERISHAYRDQQQPLCVMISRGRLGSRILTADKAACVKADVVVNSPKVTTGHADSERAFLSANSWRRERSQGGDAGLKERSTLTARPSHTMEAQGTLRFATANYGVGTLSHEHRSRNRH